jgi:hypothetical protein
MTKQKEVRCSNDQRSETEAASTAFIVRLWLSTTLFPQFSIESRATENSAGPA